MNNLCILTFKIMKAKLEVKAKDYLNKHKNRKYFTKIWKFVPLFEFLYVYFDLPEPRYIQMRGSNLWTHNGIGTS